MSGRIVNTGAIGLTFTRVLREPTDEHCGIFVNVTPLSINSSLHDFTERYQVSIEFNSFLRPVEHPYAEMGKHAGHHHMMTESRKNGLFHELTLWLGEAVTDLMLHKDLLSLMDPEKVKEAEAQFAQPGLHHNRVPFLLLAKDPQQFPELIEFVRVNTPYYPMREKFRPIVQEYLLSKKGGFKKTAEAGW